MSVMNAPWSAETRFGSHLAHRFSRGAGEHAGPWFTKCSASDATRHRSPRPLTAVIDSHVDDGCLHGTPCSKSRHLRPVEPRLRSCVSDDSATSRAREAPRRTAPRASSHHHRCEPFTTGVDAARYAWSTVAPSSVPRVMPTSNLGTSNHGDHRLTWCLITRLTPRLNSGCDCRHEPSSAMHDRTPDRCGLAVYGGRHD